jgi:hypothetical protein
MGVVLSPLRGEGGGVQESPGLGVARVVQRVRGQVLDDPSGVQDDDAS